MLRVHQRNYALAVLSSALFLGSPFPVLAALYHVDGTAGSTPDSGIPPFPESYSLDLGLTAGGGVTFTPNFGTGVHATADSLADGHGVRSHTYAQLIQPSVFGIYSLGASSTATATFSDMVVSGPVGATVSTFLNMELTGGFLFGSAADAGSTAAIASVQSVIWVYINGALVGSGSRFERADTRFAPFLSTTGMMTAWGSGNPLLITPSFDVQSGVPFDVKIRLTTSAETIISSGIGTGGSAEANSDFGHTFSFASTGPVFNLPVGYTANSVDAHIVNNQVVAVPEPSTLILGLAGFAGLGLATLRKKYRRT